VIGDAHDCVSLRHDSPSREQFGTETQPARIPFGPGTPKAVVEPKIIHLASARTDAIRGHSDAIRGHSTPALSGTRYPGYPGTQHSGSRFGG
jgi:hypothetical protein